MLLFDAPSVLPALLTPFDERGEVDAAALAAHVEFLIEAGVHGIMPCGTTGRRRCSSPTRRCGGARGGRGGRRPRAGVAHVGRGDRDDRQADRGGDRRRRGRRVGDRALLLRARRPRDRHPLPRAARGRQAPLFAYTFPARTGNELSAEAFRTLVDDGLAGLKDSTTCDIHAGYLAAAPDAQVFVGSPSHLLGSLHGSRGGVAALANLRPELILALAEAGGGSDEEAERLQEEVLAAERGSPTSRRWWRSSAVSRS